MPSPLPYRANIHCPCAEVLDANGEIVAVCEKSPRPKENAEFVARACNCNAELTDAVEYCRSIMLRLVKFSEDTRASPAVDFTLSVAVNKLEHILAKAKWDA